MKFLVLILLAIYIQYILASSGSGSGESETLPEDEGSGAEVVSKKDTQGKLFERYERLCEQLVLFVPNLCVKYAGKCLTVCAAQIPMKELDCGLKKPPNPTKKLKTNAIKEIKSKSEKINKRKAKQNKTKETKKERTTKVLKDDNEERRRKRSVKSKKTKKAESKKAVGFTKTHKTSAHKNKATKKRSLNQQVGEKDAEIVISEKEAPKYKVKKNKKDVTKNTVKSVSNKNIKNMEMAEIKADKEIDSVEHEISDLKSLDANEVTKEQGSTTNKHIKGKKNKGRNNLKSKGVARRHKVRKGSVVDELETAVNKLVGSQTSKLNTGSTENVSKTVVGGKKQANNKITKYHTAGESESKKPTETIKAKKGSNKIGGSKRASAAKVAESKETAANKITDEKETSANEVVDNQETSANEVPEFKVVAVVTEVKKMSHHKKVANKEIASNEKSSGKLASASKALKNKEVASNMPEESESTTQSETVESKDTASNKHASNKEPTSASVLKSSEPASIKVNETTNKLVENKEASATEFVKIKGSPDVKVIKKKPHLKSISSNEKTGHKKEARKTSGASEAKVEKEAASSEVVAKRKVSVKKDVTMAINAAKTDHKEAHEATRRIFGGIDSVDGEWPWQVSLRGWHNDTYVYNCGGAILSENFILTAAHCLYPEDANLTDPGQWDVFIGSHNNTEEIEYFQQLHYVKKIYVHEEYDSADKYNDIAIFQLEEAIKMGDENKGRICLPNDNVPVPESNKQCFITGWGDIVENNTRTSVLKHAPVMTVSTAVCNLPGNYNSTVDESEICAGNIQSDTDACMGDSGGSMVCQMGIRWYTTGIVSHGEGCAKPNSYGVYANVTYFKDWIVETILEKSV